MINLHFLMAQFSFENVTQQKNFSKNFSAKIVNLKKFFVKALALIDFEIWIFFKNLKKHFLKFTLKNIFYIFEDKKKTSMLKVNIEAAKKNRIDNFDRSIYSIIDMPSFYSVLSFFCNKNFSLQKGAEIW